jgi:hypothetical protein
MKWESDICEVNGSNVTRLGSIEDGYKRSTINVVETDHKWIPNGGDYIVNLWRHLNQG